MQVVDSNGQLEESELERMGLAAQELLDIQPTEVGNLITKATSLLKIPVGLRALTDELKKEMNLEGRIAFIKQL